MFFCHIIAYNWWWDVMRLHDTIYSVKQYDCDFTVQDRWLENEFMKLIAEFPPAEPCSQLKSLCILLVWHVNNIFLQKQYILPIAYSLFQAIPNNNNKWRHFPRHLKTGKAARSVIGGFDEPKLASSVLFFDAGWRWLRSFWGKASCPIRGFGSPCGFCCWHLVFCCSLKL